jgi:hypothetical protein
MQVAGRPAMMATLEEIQPHRIPLKLRVILESPSAHMVSQYLCCTDTPDSAHIIHEHMIQVRQREMPCVRALIDCTAASIFLAPRLLRKHGLPHEAAHRLTLSPNERVIRHPRDSRKPSISASYFHHLAQFDEPAVIVVPIKAYDIVLGLAWFRVRNPVIDWSPNPLLSLWTPCGSV